MDVQNTLNNTKDDDLTEETLLEELSEEELSSSTNVYKMAMGDNTPLSFFAKTKKDNKKK